jgi:hypothetical protein
MEFFELLAKELGTPVLCFDGLVGMLAKHPSGESATDLAGIEVPGEPDIRWVPPQDLQRAGWALRQSGSPRFPLASRDASLSEHATLARRLSNELWNALQLEELREHGLRALRPGRKSS